MLSFVQRLPYLFIYLFVCLFVCLPRGTSAWCGVSVPRPGIEHGLQQWKCQIPTTRPPGNSHSHHLSSRNETISWSFSSVEHWFFFLLLLLFFFKPAPAAYGSSQAKESNQSCICNLSCSSWKQQTLNAMSKAKASHRDYIRSLTC